MIKLVNGDAVEALERCEKVKCIIMDPPDNLGLQYAGDLTRDKRSKTEYYNWLELLIVKAMLKCQVLWISHHPDHSLELSWMVRNILRYRHPSWISRGFMWTFTFGQYNDHDFSHGYRPIMRLSAPGTIWYPDAVRVVSERMLIGDARAVGPRVPSNVWEAPRVVGNSGERRQWHPTQHPESIYERMIQFSCSYFEKTIDLFTGSGTGLRVGKRLGKHVIGVEQSEFYCRELVAEFGKDLEIEECV